MGALVRDKLRIKEGEGCAQGPTRISEISTAGTVALELPTSQGYQGGESRRGALTFLSQKSWKVLGLNLNPGAVTSRSGFVPGLQVDNEEQIPRSHAVVWRLELPRWECETVIPLRGLRRGGTWWNSSFHIHEEEAWRWAGHWYSGVLCQKNGDCQIQLYQSLTSSPQKELSLKHLTHICSRQLYFYHFLSSPSQIVIKVWLKQIATKFHMPLCIPGLASKLREGCLSLDKRSLKCQSFKKIIFLPRDITMGYQSRRQGKRTKSRNASPFSLVI